MKEREPKNNLVSMSDFEHLRRSTKEAAAKVKEASLPSVELSGEQIAELQQVIERVLAEYVTRESLAEDYNHRLIKPENEQYQSIAVHSDFELEQAVKEQRTHMKKRTLPQVRDILLRFKRDKEQGRQSYHSGIFLTAAAERAQELLGEPTSFQSF